MSPTPLLLALLAALASATLPASATEPGTSDTEAEVAVAAHAALADIWPDAEVEVVRLSPSVQGAAPPLQVVFADDAPRGRASARVHARTESGWVEAGWAFLDVVVYQTAAVLTRDLARGDSLGDAITTERIDATRLADLLDPHDLDGWTARRSLRAGTALTDRLALPPAAVDSRGPVRVRYARGGVRITLDCTARERGAVGETIRATCDGAASPYRVRLTAPGLADWAGTL